MDIHHSFYMNWLSIILDQTVPDKCVTGEARLVEGSVKSEGRVEVCINSVWGSVCRGSSYYWDSSDTKVLCRQLGHQELGVSIMLLACIE